MNNNKELKNVIIQITNIQLVGNAILSKWRHITHWLETSLARPECAEWFVIALTRLEELNR